jgi:hypothetical protein
VTNGVSGLAVVVFACSLPAGAGEPGPPLVDLLARAGAYSERYERDFADLTAEETYTQKLFRHRNLRLQQVRTLRSDMVFVRLGDSDLRWMAFRDVFEVDGKTVRERDDRLETLFVKARESAYGEAQQILEESARYNVGKTVRNFNMPTLALVFLHPENQGRFRFKKKGKTAVGSGAGWKIEYEETRSPAFIRDGANHNLFAHGSVVVGETDGRLLRSHMAVKDAVEEFQVEMTVEFGPWEGSEIWVPLEMREMCTFLPPAVDRVPNRRGTRGPNVLAGRTNISVDGEYVETIATYSQYHPFGSVLEDGEPRSKDNP